MGSVACNCHGVQDSGEHSWFLADVQRPWLLPGALGITDFCPAEGLCLDVPSDDGKLVSEVVGVRRVHLPTVLVWPCAFRVGLARDRPWAATDGGMLPPRFRRSCCPWLSVGSCPVPVSARVRPWATTESSSVAAPVPSLLLPLAFTLGFVLCSRALLCICRRMACVRLCFHRRTRWSCPTRSRIDPGCAGIALV